MNVIRRYPIVTFPLETAMDRQDILHRITHSQPIDTDVDQAAASIAHHLAQWEQCPSSMTLDELLGAISVLYRHARESGASGRSCRPYLPIDAYSATAALGGRPMQ